VYCLSGGSILPKALAETKRQSACQAEVLRVTAFSLNDYLSKIKEKNK